MNTNTTQKTTALVLTGVLTALITVCTMVLPIPIPMTTGYVNLGDGIIFLSVMLLGFQYGAFAGGVGACLADILLGAAAWAPWTLVIKAGMALIVGIFLKMDGDSQKSTAIPLKGLVGMAVATIFMTAGYYVAEAVMYGSWIAPVVGIPWNLLQGCVGIVVAYVLTAALKKTSAARYFTY